MATLTTLTGVVVNFNPSSVDAIADHDTTGKAVTCIFGVGDTILLIAESVSDFMQRLGIEKDFAKLTRANRWPVWINGAAVSWFREARPSDA